MINEFLTKHNMSAYTLAHLLGRTQGTVGRWRKKGVPYKKEMELTLEALDRRLRDTPATAEERQP